ncbi:MAG: fused MFS/spermidine synthase [Dokdonella sp.]|uniref:fused MFS/spermidine synthase n=1 Tax=Dokdonella sp. TaxID=2291710 RepID=UPI0032655180
MINERVARSGVVLMLLFAISGFAGLIYESIWTQYLGLFLGHAAYAQSFVLVLFMGGMALGALIASRYSERMARPLVWYALIELLIGIAGITFDPVYRALSGFAYDVLFPMAGSGIGVELIRYLVAAVLIGAQCILLGATFPLMSAGYLRLTPASGGRVLAGLYFSNSLGAAIGALTATFVLLPGVGLPGTVLTGGMISVLVAVAIWPFAKQPTQARRASTAIDGGNVVATLIFAAAAITGATSFVYEITWIRMLALALGTTLHAFELMLAAFISGIAFGGLWLRRRADGMQNPLAIAGWAQVLMGVAALVSLFVYMHAFEWVSWLMAAVNRNGAGYVMFNLTSAAIAVAVMFPAAFFAGMTLPLLTLALIQRGAGERAIGRVYSANTVGAIVGVLLTIHVLMPLLGVRIALWLAAIADIVLGIYLLGRDAKREQRTPSLVFASVAAGALIVVAFVGTAVDSRTLASSVYRSGIATLSQNFQMLFHKDGKTATVSMFQAPGPTQHRSIATNGKVDAGIDTQPDAPASGDEYTMGLAAAVPLSLSANPATVAVIGFGSGMTVHTLLGSDRVQRVDVVEIEPLMVEAARQFGDRVQRAYSDPRAHIIIDDAKAYMSGNGLTYDVIVSEPSNPWMGGTATLFSDEFYGFVPKHLNADGVFVQWLQLYEITPDLVASVLKAMLPHFADVHAYLTNSSDMLLVASVKQPLRPNLDVVSLDPRLQQELARIGVRDAKDIATYRVLDRRGLEALTQGTGEPANSDFFPVLQLQAPKARFMNGRATTINELQQAAWPLLEVTAGYEPVSVLREERPQGATMARDTGVRTARALRTALLRVSSIDEDPETSNLPSDFKFLKTVAGICQIDAMPDAWVEASVAAAASTIPYLSAEDLKGIWIDPSWFAQCRPTNPTVLAALKFHAAMAARNWSEVATQGDAILARAAAGTPIFDAYVLGAMELAELALGHASGPRSVEDRYGARIRGHEVERQWMLTLGSMAGSENEAASNMSQ